MTPSERAAKWNKENPERAAAANKKYRDSVRFDPVKLAKRRERTNAWYERNQTSSVACHSKWRNENEWAKISDRIRSLIRMTVRGHLDGGVTFQNIVGCTGRQLRAHLEAQFKPNMGWHNFGKQGWNISHIKPVASFKEVLHTHEGKQQCFHYSNLQPEWARHNLVKFTYMELTDAQKTLEDSRAEVISVDTGKLQE